MIGAMMGLGGLMAGAGAVGAASSGALEDVPTIGYYEANKNNYTYGGSERDYLESLSDYDKMARAARERDAYQLDWSQANADYDRQLQARGMQGEAAQNYRDVLSGKAQSVAALQAEQGGQRAQAHALQTAASVSGGGAGRALAARQAMRVGAEAQLDASGKAAIVRAQEQEMARQGLAGVANQMRAGDAASRQQSMGGAQAQGQLEMQQRALNDQSSMGYTGMRKDVMDRNYAGQMGWDQANQNAYYQTAQTNSQIDAANKQRQAQFWGSLTGGGASMMGMGMGG